MKYFPPNYKDGSLVNLMSSISGAFGVNTGYGEAKALPTKKIKGYRNVILLVIDGLGYNYLMNQNDSELKKHILGKLTSVCPSTTAAAITTFMTGVAPAEHGSLGWFVNLKEIGCQGLPLKFDTRFGRLPISKAKIGVGDLYFDRPLFSRLKTKAISVMHKILTGSDYNGFYLKHAKILEYSTLDRLFIQVENAAKLSGKKFIYTYWDGFDSHCHEYGIASKKTRAHFKDIDRKFSKVIKKLHGTNSLIIAVADHGLVDIELKNTLFVDDHPELRDCLTMPLTGEGRFAYAHVRPSKVRQFKEFFKKNNGFRIVESEHAIKQGWFGTGKIDKRVFDRAGDFIIIADNKHVIRDFLLKQERKVHKGNHGGVSEDEMVVPLIVVRT